MQIKKIKDEEGLCNDPMEIATNNEDDNMDCDIDDISSNMERNIRVNGSEVAVKSNIKIPEEVR